MIQSKINRTSTPWDGVEFPVLAYNKDLDIIIIASEKDDCLKGAVVYSNNPEHPIGEYYQYWRKSAFCPFEEELILKNKSK